MKIPKKQLRKNYYNHRLSVPIFFYLEKIKEKERLKLKLFDVGSDRKQYVQTANHSTRQALNMIQYTRFEIEMNFAYIFSVVVVPVIALIHFCN